MEIIVIHLKMYNSKKSNGYTLSFSFSLQQNKFLVSLDGDLIGEKNLPSDFSLRFLESDQKEFDSKLFFTNYSNGQIFYGYIKDLIISNKFHNASELILLNSDTAISNISNTNNTIDLSQLSGKEAYCGAQDLTIILLGSDGSFETKENGRTFTVYDKETKEPLFFSYAGEKDIVINEYSTALFLATENFLPILRTDNNIISQYNQSVIDSPELSQLANEILTSINLYGRIR